MRRGWIDPARERVAIDQAERLRLMSPMDACRERVEMMTRHPAIGTHLATLNLFREPDGTVEITVAGAPGATAEFKTAGLCGRPIDYVELLIMEAAERMAARIALAATTAPRAGNGCDAE